MSDPSELLTGTELPSKTAIGALLSIVMPAIVVWKYITKTEGEKNAEKDAQEKRIELERLEREKVIQQLKELTTAVSRIDFSMQKEVSTLTLIIGQSSARSDRIEHELEKAVTEIGKLKDAVAELREFKARESGIRHMEDHE